MIFVVLGTQDKSFKRLLMAIEDHIKKGNIKQKVVVQAGHTIYKSDYMDVLDFIPMKEFNQYIKKSDLIITHGGVGTILDSLKEGKKVIAVPRLKEYAEHENNHQLQIIEQFEQEGYIISCLKLENLDQKIEEIQTFEPKKYIGDNQKMIQIITNYIDQI